MALTKVTYKDGSTVITAKNLNDIQDEIISQASAKAPVASPNFTGTPKAPTAAETVDNTQIASTAFANRAAANAVSTFVRPNMLDNWDFTCTVNQRENSSYTGAGYGIDRWRMAGRNYANAKITVGSSSVTFDNSDASDQNWWRQVLKMPIVAGTYTLSVFVKSATGSCYLFFISGSSSVTSVPITGPGVFTKTYTSAAGAFNGVGILAYAGAVLEIEAIKLERGDTQTIAHQENGEWVRNEYADHLDELSKCQRYFQRCSVAGGANQTIGFGFGSTTKLFLFNYPSRMMAMLPTMTFSESMILRVYQSGASIVSIDPSAITVAPYQFDESKGFLTIQINVPSGNSTQFLSEDPGIVSARANNVKGYFDLSCEL